MALAKKVVEDFNRVYAPATSNPSQHDGRTDGSNGMDEQVDTVQIKVNDLDDDAQDGVYNEEEKKASSTTLHMDTCKIKHEESAN